MSATSRGRSALHKQLPVEFRGAAPHAVKFAGDQGMASAFGDDGAVVADVLGFAFASDPRALAFTVWCKNRCGSEPRHRACRCHDSRFLCWRPVEFETISRVMIVPSAPAAGHGIAFRATRSRLARDCPPLSIGDGCVLTKGAERGVEQPYCSPRDDKDGTEGHIEPIWGSGRGWRWFARIRSSIRLRSRGPPPDRPRGPAEAELGGLDRWCVPSTACEERAQAPSLGCTGLP